MKQIKIKSRMIALLAAVLMTSSIAFAQTSTSKHIVERGETLESIAEKYGVSKDDIVKLNPDAGQFVYVGMELVVPEKETEIPKVTVNTSDVNYSKYIEEQNNDTGIAVNTDKLIDKLKIGIVVGYSLNNYTGKDIKDTKNKGGFHIGIDVRYNIDEMFFVEGLVGIATKGYKKEEFETSGQGWVEDDPNYDVTTKTTMKTTNIEIPLFIGATYNGFFAKVGPYFSYALDGKKKEDVKDIIYEDIHSSSEGNNTYETKIGDMKDFNRFTIGIGAGIGYCYDKFLIQFTYQRGLTKLYDKSKKYEQNILFSVGYFF